MLRGWIGPSRFLSERKQRALLLEAKVEERVIYDAGSWPEFLRGLRPERGDKAVIADLRVFGSRRALMVAAEEVAACGATLYVVEDDADIHLPTLRAVDRTLTRWRSGYTLSSKKASKLGQRGAAARKKQIAESRLDEDVARPIWQDPVRYQTEADALAHMPGWTRTTAWRRLGGGREKFIRKPKRKR